MMGKEVAEKENNSAHRVAAVVLAAGESSRFGSPKQLAEIDGKPMIARIVGRVAQSNVERTVVVLGCEFEKVSDALAGFPEVEVLENPEYRSGIAGSLKVGLSRIGELDAVMFVLGDLPGLGTADIDAVLGAYLRSNAPLALGKVDGVQAHPVIFRKDLWPELQGTGGDIGGRDVVKAHLHEAVTVELPPSCGADIDTLEDYLRGNGGSSGE